MPLQEGGSCPRIQQAWSFKPVTAGSGNAGQVNTCLHGPLRSGIFGTRSGCKPSFFFVPSNRDSGPGAPLVLILVLNQVRGCDHSSLQNDCLENFPFKQHFLGGPQPDVPHLLEQAPRGSLRRWNESCRGSRISSPVNSWLDLGEVISSFHFPYKSRESWFSERRREQLCPHGSACSPGFCSGEAFGTPQPSAETLSGAGGLCLGTYFPPLFHTCNAVLCL